jgi:hypothetical protein
MGDQAVFYGGSEDVVWRVADVVLGVVEWLMFSMCRTMGQSYQSARHGVEAYVAGVVAVAYDWGDGARKAYGATTAPVRAVGPASV